MTTVGERSLVVLGCYEISAPDKEHVYRLDRMTGEVCRLDVNGRELVCTERGEKSTTLREMLDEKVDEIRRERGAD